MRTCDICNKEFTKKSWSYHHDYHEDDCPNFVDLATYPDAEYPIGGCDCDLVAHDECCPQCNRKDD